ncbi:MAG TPA: hypothetical protein VLE97_07875, partial [Gaiellaceae bacterium]|nr:hypothetical protein [Gaiellaceae bacterium]
ADVVTTASHLDFEGDDFDVTQSPSGEANISLSSDVARDADVAAEAAARTAAVAAEAVLARNANNLTSGTVADARIASTIARDSEVTAAVAAEATLARNADNLTSGTVADARIPGTIARDSEVAAAVTAHEAALDPHPTYLTQAESDTLYDAVGAASVVDSNLNDHLNDAADAHDASAISILDAANDFAATDVEGALAELQSDAEADATALSDHIADTSAAHAASAIGFTPDGSISSTNVQAAIQEVRDEAGAATPAASAITIADAANDFTATNVEDALAELQSDAEADATALSDHLADTSDAHDASAISILDTANDFAATDVEGALAELQSDAEADATALADHLADTSDAHDASAISILDTANDFTATDVEGALAELQSFDEATELTLASLQTQSALQAALTEARRIADLGYFVCSGLALSPNATPTKLNMAVGVQFAGTTELNVTAQTAITPGAGASKDTITELSDATNPKWVVVELDGSNVVQYNEGTAAASPTFPTITANRTVLGFVYLPSTAVNTTGEVDILLDTNNGKAKLIDARIVRSVHVARLLFTDTAATSQALTSGVAASLLAATYTLPANSLNVGDTIIVEGSIRYINTSNASTLILRIVSTTGNLVQYTIPSMTSNAAARWISFRAEIVVKATGTSTGANVELSSMIITSAASATVPATQFDVAGGGTNTGLDTTANQVIDLTVQSSAAGATAALRAFAITKFPAQ